MKRKVVSLAALVAQEKPLVVPVGYDPISTRMIERAGFPMAGLGGFGLVGTFLQFFFFFLQAAVLQPQNGHLVVQRMVALL